MFCPLRSGSNSEALKPPGLCRPQLGLAAGAKMSVRDVTSQKDLPAATGDRQPAACSCNPYYRERQSAFCNCKLTWSGVLLPAGSWAGTVGKHDVAFIQLSPSS